MPVDTVCPEYAEYLGRWERCRDCASGTDAVKGAGAKYLPRLDSHISKPQKYDEYRMRAYFYNATGRTIEALSGVVFQKAPTFKLPALVKDDVRDITLSGVPAEIFALKATREVLTTGRYGVLVDFVGDDTPMDGGSAPVPTDKQRSGDEIRPYWAGYRAEDIISWRTERRRGDQVTTLIVLREQEDKIDPDDRFKSKYVTRYRVLQLMGGVYSQEIWEENDKHEYELASSLIPSRRGEALDEIPFVFIGPTSVSPEVERPPLLDLVDTNLSHYRTMAQLEHGRHWTALPTPWVAGRLGQASEPLAIGSGTAWELDVQGRAGMLEFTGQGLGALEKADEVKRRLMATLGARMLEEQPTGSAETMGAVAMRHAGEHASMRTVAQAIEQGLTIACQWHAWWMGTDDDPKATNALVELNKDFFAVRMSPEELKGLVLALQAGKIAYKTFYAQLVRGDIARPGITAEQELKEIEAEAPEPVVPPDENVPPGDGGPPAEGGPPTPPQPPKPSGGQPGATGGD